jgi:DNA-directed RNA polymerase specialized sigma24 family protein
LSTVQSKIGLPNELTETIMEFWATYHQDKARVRKFIFALVKDEWPSDDLIQEALIRVQKSLNQVREKSKLSPWVFRIANNLCQDHFRRMINLPGRAGH